MKNKNILMKRQFAGLMLAVCTLMVHAQGFDGSWKGVLDLGQAKLNLVFNITKDAAGKLSCTMDSPDQGAKGIPSEITAEGDTALQIKVPAIGMTYTGRLKDGMIKGTFMQGAFSAPLDMTPGKVEQKRPQTPQPPYPYATEEVTFTNAADNAVLSATLTIPAEAQRKGRGKMPVVVMVTGSGLQNRDEEVFGHKPFLVLADFLARRGIASLRYDDRGTGRSTGDAASATTMTFMTDALAAVDYLRRDGRFGRVGVAGHSEGGTIAFMIGGQGKADFIVSMAGMAVRGDALLVDQNRRLLAASGLEPAVCDDYCRALQRVFDLVSSGRAMKTPAEEVKNIIAETRANLPAPLVSNLVAVLSKMNVWTKYFISCDPSSYIRTTRCPVMAVNGSKDKQVSSVINLDAIRRLLPENKRNVVKEYDGLNHLFQHCTTGDVSEYGQIEETMSPEVMKDMADWVLGK